MKQTYSISITLLISLLCLTACEQKCHIVMRNNQGGINWHSIHTLSATEQDTLNRLLMSEIQYDDSVPDFSRALLVSEAKNYDDMDINSFAVYTKPYTVNNPRTENQIEKMAIWCTKNATYLAQIHKIHWNKMYFRNSSKMSIRDSKTGDYYYIRHCLDYPMDSTFWINSIAGEWIVIVNEFPPLPKECTFIDILDESEAPKKTDDNTGCTKNIGYRGIRVSALQMQQSKMDFKETIIIR